MSDRFAEGRSVRPPEQDVVGKLNWSQIQTEAHQSTRQQSGSVIDNQSLVRGKDPSTMQEKNEPYPGYNDQLASDRKYLQERLDQLCQSVEKITGFGIGAWGIWGEKFRASGKYLPKIDYQVNLTPMPSADQSERLNQIKNQLDYLTLAGRTTGSAVLKKEQEELEKKILLRTKIISSGGLALGFGCGQMIDQFIFHKDSPGDGSFVADVIAAPALSWMVPKNLALKTGSIIAAHLAGKLWDHWLQPKYLYNAKDENGSQQPTTEINQFRSPLAPSSENEQPVDPEPLLWPQSDSIRDIGSE